MLPSKAQGQRPTSCQQDRGRQHGLLLDPMHSSWSRSHSGQSQGRGRQGLLLSYTGLFHLCRPAAVLPCRQPVDQAGDWVSLGGYQSPVLSLQHLSPSAFRIRAAYRQNSGWVSSGSPGLARPALAPEVIPAWNLLSCSCEDFAPSWPHSL